MNMNMHRSSSTPITRVLSVRCNDVDLALCAQFLERLGTPMNTTSDIIKNVLALVASQAERTGITPMSLQIAREFLTERYGSAGMNRNKHTYAEQAFAQNRLQFSATPDLVQETPKTSSGIELSGKRILDYTQWLSENKKTKDECSFEQWHELLQQQQRDEQRLMVEKYSAKYISPQQQDTLDTIKASKNQTENVPVGCDPSLPIATSDMSEELNAKAQERQQRDEEEKRAMEEFTRGLAQEGSHAS